MKDYVLGLDVWEGNLDIVEDELEDGGVAFLVIRLNSIEGTTHLDENFPRQWAQAERFVRWPYFVFNPWLRGKENLEWLGDHLSLYCPGVKRVGIDIEIKRLGLSPAAYAAEVGTFMTLAERLWRPVVYTGPWFLPVLSAWPKDQDYWWGRYPYSMHPEKSVNLTWQELHEKIADLQWLPDAAPACPGPVKVWQCSGDRFKLPGTCGRCVDINLWKGSIVHLIAWAQHGQPAPEKWEYALTEWARGLGYTGPDPDRLP